MSHSAGKTACHAGSWWRARQEMSKLIANYDSSTAGDALLRALVACGASDVAHSLSQSRSASQVCILFWLPILHSTLSLEKTWHAFCTLSHLITMHKQVYFHAGFLARGGCTHSFHWGKAKKVGCRYHCQQRLPLQLWKASGMHWWQEPWLLTNILKTTQGELQAV